MVLLGWKFRTVPYNFYRLVKQSYVHLYVGVNFIHTNPFLIAIDSLNMQSWICRGEFYSYKPFFIAIDSLNVQSWICNQNNFLPPLRFHKWTAGWGGGGTKPQTNIGTLQEHPIIVQLRTRERRTIPNMKRLQLFTFHNIS